MSHSMSYNKNMHCGALVKDVMIVGQQVHSVRYVKFSDVAREIRGVCPNFGESYVKKYVALDEFIPALKISAAIVTYADFLHILSAAHIVYGEMDSDERERMLKAARIAINGVCNVNLSE